MLLRYELLVPLGSYYEFATWLFLEKFLLFIAVTCLLSRFRAEPKVYLSILN